MNEVGYCTQPGSAYPWSSVRRYILENQGFVKRMYGEQRQSQIVRDEIHMLNSKYYMDYTPGYRNGKTEDVDDDSGDVLQSIELNQANVSTKVSNETQSFNLDNITVSSIKEDEERVEADISTTPLTENLINIDTSQLFSDQENIDQTTETVVEDQAEPDKPQKGFNACPITQEVVAPYWANNTRGETLALLNVYPFEQYIHWEKCAFEGEQMFCRDGCRCEQQYRLHRLLAFDPKNECRGVFADWFRFPGCCVCICYNNQERINNRKARL